MKRLFDTEWWAEIFQSLNKNRKRSIYTSIGVVWATFLLVLLLGVGLGLRKMAESEMGGESRMFLSLSSGCTSIAHEGMTSGRWWEMKYSDLKYINHIKGVELTGCNSYNLFFKATFEDLNYDIYLSGINTGHITASNIKLKHGRDFNDLDLLVNRKVCIIPSTLAEKLTPGNPSGMLGKQLLIRNTYTTVVGIYHTDYTYMYSVYTPFTTFSNIFASSFSLKDEISTLTVLCKKGADVEYIENECRKYFSKKYNFAVEDNNALVIYSSLSLMKLVNGMFGGISFLTWFVGLGSLLAGMVGISNIMLITVKERRQEIGVRRAMGATPKDIIMQIIAESSVLGILSGLSGMALAMIVQIILGEALKGQNIEPGTFQLSWGMAMLSFAIILVGSIISGILPAAKAIDIQPVDALREE